MHNVCLAKLHGDHVCFILQIDVIYEIVYILIYHMHPCYMDG